MLQLTLDTPSEPFIAEGEISLTVRLSNRGSQPESVPSPRGLSAFDYCIYSGEDRIATASLQQMLAARNQARLFAGGPSPGRLAPGASLTYREDLSPLLASPLAPGQYHLEARHTPATGDGPIVSNRVALEVVTPRPKAILQTLDGPFIEAIEFLDRDAGQIVLRQRDSLLDPQDSFKEIHIFTPSSGLGDTALAVSIQPGQPEYWRWLAWLDGTNFHAGVSQSTALTYQTGAVPATLDSPVLLPHGYGFPDGRGLFLLSGFEGGERRIQTVTLLPEKGRPPIFTTVALASLPAAPAATTQVVREDGSAETRLLWLLSSHGNQAIAECSIDSASGAVITKPHSVLVSRRNFAAHSFEPLQLAVSPASHQLLLAPEVPDVNYTLVRMRAGDVSHPDETDLPPNQAFDEHGVDRWVFPSRVLRQPVIGALSEGKIWVTQGSDWRLLDADNVLAPSVRLWTLLDSQLWCTWFDTAYGYRRIRLA